MSILQVFGRRIGRFWFIYAVGTGLFAVLSLSQIIVLTHFVSPSQLGHLAALQAVGALVTVMLLMGTLQGTMSRVFGTRGDDEGVDEPADDAPTGPAPTTSIPTGLTIMLSLGSVLVAIVWILAPWLSGLLLGRTSGAGLVRAMAIAGAVGAPFRLLLMYPRYGRRPVRYIAMENGRLIISTAVSITLLAGGMGIQAVVIGTVAGEAIGILVSLFLNKHEIQLRFELAEAKVIMRNGASYAPVLLANFVMLHADVLVLTAFTSAASVGRYRLAIGVARMVVYPVQIFLLAWGPLTSSPLAAAAEEGRSPGALGILLLRYALIAGVGLLVLATLFGSVLVKVSPASYAGAAGLIPLIGAGYVVRALYVIMYRTALFPSKRLGFISLFSIGGIIFMVLSLLLTPHLHGVGVAIARIVAFSVALTGIVTLSQLSSEPLDLPWDKLIITVTAGVFSWVVGELAGQVFGAAALLGILLYAALIIVSRALPREQIRPLLQMFGALKPTSRRKRTEERLRSLRHSDVELLRAAVREHVPVARIAAQRHEGPDETLMTLARILNFVSEREDGERIAPEAVSYALTYQLMARHERQGRELISAGVSPRSLDSVEETVKILRRIPLRRWVAFDPDGGGRSRYFLPSF